MSDSLPTFKDVLAAENAAIEADLDYARCLNNPGLSEADIASVSEDAAAAHAKLDRVIDSYIVDLQVKIAILREE